MSEDRSPFPLSGKAIKRTEKAQQQKEVNKEPRILSRI